MVPRRKRETHYQIDTCSEVYPLAGAPCVFASVRICRSLSPIGSLTGSAVTLSKPLAVYGSTKTSGWRVRVQRCCCEIQRSKTVLINGESYPVVEGRVTPQQAPCLNKPGIYGVRLDGRVEGKRIEIAQADVNIALLTSHGWHQDTDAWPWPEWVWQHPFPATPDHRFYRQRTCFSRRARALQQGDPTCRTAMVGTGTLHP